MAIEEQIQRLAIAIERQGDAAAVREIIRQRDEAQKSLSSMTVWRNSWQQEANERRIEIDHLRRQVAGLKGALTRAKRKAGA